MSNPMARRLRGDDERGSLPLALLAMIVVAGLVGVVAASTIAGERSVRFDQGFTGSVHVAEVGVAEVLHLLNTGQLSYQDAPVTGSGTSDGEAYEWTADTDFVDGDAGPAEWTVTSTGDGTDDVTRTLEVQMSDGPLFDLGAFSKVVLTFTGGNTADSYTSDESVPDADAWCTGNGRVGSNDDIDFGGSAPSGPCSDEDYRRSDQTVDGVDLFDWDANPDPARCHHSGGSNCYEGNNPDNTWYLETHDERIEIGSDVEWMKEVLGADPGDDGQNGYQCQDANSQGDWLIDETRSPLAPADSSNGVKVNYLSDHSAGPGDVYAYCADTVTFDGLVQLTSDADAENPVVLVVGERVDFRPQGGAVNIACDEVDCGSGFDPTTVRPEAAALQIYSPAPSDVGASNADVVHALNHVKIAAAIYAPRGSCGGTGNAQIDLFGALVCGNVRNQGGWQFHYDDSLGGAVRTGDYGIIQWSEQ